MVVEYGGGIWWWNMVAVIGECGGDYYDQNSKL
jgi:hypothetical protein